MIRLYSIIVFIVSIFSLSAVAQTRTLVWADEFDTNGLPDSTRWGYDLGDGCPNVCNWGNNEKQYYTRRAENAVVKGGKLIITARKEAMKDHAYTSARMVSTASWLYGRVEVRAKLPQGKGTWPAIWMLPKDWKYGGWPKSGEIDIMEHVGYAPDKIFGTVHTEAYNHSIHTQRGDSLTLPTVEKGFHRYGIDWTAESISFFVDDVTFFTFKKEADNAAQWPFNQPFQVLLNLAVGGNWGGKYGVDDNIFPQTLVIDYVRIYAPASK